MPRFLTTRGLRAIQAEVENAALLALVTISYAPTGTMFRVVNNTMPIISRGNTFYPWAFQFTLPQDSLDRTPDLEFAIDNVSEDLIDMLRAATSPPGFLIEVIISDTPDVVEMSVGNLLLRNVKWDKQQILGTLAVDDIFGLAYPSRFSVYDPTQFPGLFP